MKIAIKATIKKAMSTNIPSSNRIINPAESKNKQRLNQRFIMRRIYVVEEILKELVDNSMMNRVDDKGWTLAVGYRSTLCYVVDISRVCELQDLNEVWAQTKQFQEA